MCIWPKVMSIVGGQGGIQAHLLDFKIYAIVHLSLFLLPHDSRSYLKRQLSYLSNSSLQVKHAEYFQLYISELSLHLDHPPQFVTVPLQVCHLGQITELSVWSDKCRKAPSMKALNLGQTLEVERSKSLSCRHLPPNAFLVGPIHFAFKKDVTYIFPNKLRAFFLPGHSKQAGTFGLPSTAELEWTFEELFMGRMLIT